MRGYFFLSSLSDGKSSENKFFLNVFTLLGDTFLSLSLGLYVPAGKLGPPPSLGNCRREREKVGIVTHRSPR